MKCIDFKEANKKLTRPPGMLVDKCGSLLIWSDDVVCISCWEVSLWEQIKIACTGKIWLGIRSGASQPPVFLTTQKPVRKRK